MNMTKLPITLTDLLRERTVESERIEYKTGWKPDPIIRIVSNALRWKRTVESYQ